MSTAKAVAAKSAALITRDFFVPHVSTVPANAGQLVGLHVRQKVSPATLRKSPGGAHVVLLVHGGSSPSVPVFDFDHRDYSWMNHLARGGLNVFTMDLTGYGSSPRPMMDDPCNINPHQQRSVMPRTLQGRRKPNYPFELVTLRDNWAEIDTVVDYLRAQCKVRRIGILGWSAGCTRVGSYSALHPEKIERVVLYAGGRPSPTLKIPDRPGPGAPIKLQTRESLEKLRWDPFVGCPEQIAPGVRDLMWRQTMDWDRIGASWGPAEGVMRIPNRTAFGWTTQLARKLAAPTLVMTGQFDHPEQRYATYSEIGPSRKAFLSIACGSHFIQWEKQHKALHIASLEWLGSGTLCGRQRGEFSVDAQGRFHQEKGK
jgi:pimeloyl-ACP methyl ester carboxylesterase